MSASSENKDKAIIFDVGGVIASDSYNVLIADLFQNKIDNEKYKNLMKSGNHSWSNYKYGSITEDEFWNNIVSENEFLLELNKELIISKDYSLENKQDWINFFKQYIRNKTLYLFTDTLKLIEELQKQHSNIMIGILSNHSKEWANYIFNELDNGHVKQVFHSTPSDLIIWSCDVNLAKPEPKIYELLISRIKNHLPNLKTENICFIDDKDRNLEIAKECGIYCIEYNASKNRNINKLKEDLEIFLMM
ncbi:hypothetical protein ABK040_007146 [Willaertia magna]